MQVTITLHATCPVCSYRNEGLQVGTAQPRMHSLRLQPGLIGWCPSTCTECGQPLDRQLFDRGILDAESAAKLNAWRERQRRRHATRKRAA